MLIRIRCDIAYEPNSESEAPQLYDLIEEARRRIDAGVVINEGEINEERGYFEVQECLHMDMPPGPCVVKERWETGRGQVI
jgi:hypothetical protein